MIQTELDPKLRNWTATELRQLPILERDAILSAAAQHAEEDYRQNPELTPSMHLERMIRMPLLPKGWDEQRVKQLLTELDARTDDEWIAADEAAATEECEQSVITVPTALLPEIRRILAQ